jgi:N-acetylglutamate synthase-like GNAT family acetyltransferase
MQPSVTSEILDYADSMQPAVIDLIVSIQRHEFGFEIAGADQPDLSDIQNFYQTGAGGFWVALADGAVVGTIALRDIGNQQGALRKMFVKAPHRGSPHAVAARLLRHLIAFANRKRVREIYLGTTEKFVAAHRFYEKNGFIRLPADKLPEAFPRMALDTRFYLKELIHEQ